MPASNWVNGNGQVSTSHDREHNNLALTKSYLQGAFVKSSNYVFSCKLQT